MSEKSLIISIRTYPTPIVKQPLRDEDTIEILNWALDLSRLCQECGVEIVLSEMAKAPQLREALSELTMAHDSQSLREVLGKHPELLSMETDKTLDLAIRGAELGNESRLVGYLKYNRSFLQYLRARGVDNVVDDMEWSYAILQPLFEYLWADTDIEARTILESHPEILSDDAQYFLQQWLELPDTREAFTKTATAYKRWAILTISRELGSKRAFEELLPFISAGEALFALISARDEGSIREVLKRNPILFTDEMDKFLEEVMEIDWSTEDQGIHDTAILYREFLTRCRSVSIEKAMEYIRQRL